MKHGSTRSIGALITVFCSCVPSSAACETWVPLQFREPMPISYLVDVDGLTVNGSRRSIPAKWVLASDVYQAGAWQFDCRARAWRSGGNYTVVKGGSVIRTVSLPEVWRTPKPASSTEQLLVAVCAAPTGTSRDWLLQQLKSPSR
jgi:hypothetical protein